MPSFPRSDVSAAVAIAIGLVAQPSAASSVTGLTIRDVGSNSTNAAGGYSSALDGRSGAFRLSSGYIDVSSYAGTELWTGDAGTDTVIGGGTDNPPGSFSTGFSILDGANWVPYTLGDGFQADISGGVLSITSLDWAFTTGDLPPGHLPSQPEVTHQVEVLWTVPTANASDFNVAFRWGHDIVSSAEDPSLTWGAFTAQWVLEGCASTAGNVGAACGAAVVPLPATTWLLCSGLAGLMCTARRRGHRTGGSST